MTITLRDLAMFALGVPLGWMLCVFARWLMVGRTPCTFCNGHGYFASETAKTKVFDSVLEESKRFKP